MSPDDPGVPDADAALDELLDAIHEHLAATQERPVERSASRWIGEAEAVARDLAAADLAPAVVYERLGHVQELLDEVDGTEDETADEHVAVATTLTVTARERSETASEE